MKKNSPYSDSDSDLLSRFKLILLHYPVEPAELGLCAMSLSIGVWLLNPFFDTFNTVSTYKYIITILPEPLLGVITLALGFARLYGLLSNNLPLRRLVGLLGNVLWLFLSIGAILGNPAALAVPMFSSMSLTSLWVYLKLPPLRSRR